MMDILSSYELLFFSENFNSEFYNSHKILHYAIIVATTFIRLHQDTIPNGNIVGPIISTILFGFAFMAKYLSTTRNSEN